MSKGSGGGLVRVLGVDWCREVPRAGWFECVVRKWRGAKAVRKDWLGWGGCPERTWVGPVGRKSVLVGQMVGNWVGMVCCWCCFDRRDRSLHSHS